jgi:hypothetical protein
LHRLKPFDADAEVTRGITQHGCFGKNLRPKRIEFAMHYDIHCMFIQSKLKLLAIAALGVAGATQAATFSLRDGTLAGDGQPVLQNIRAGFKLGEGKWEIVSFAPVENGVAVLGLADQFNSTGAIIKKHWRGQSKLTVTLRDGGEFVAWCEQSPKEISEAKDKLEFAFDPVTGKLACPVPSGARTQLNLKW